jgi:predicted nuclease of predicted toxin-antitoxin system
MRIWVDAQLSPHLAPWLTERFGIEAYSVRWLGYRDATDEAIFAAAREAEAVVMTKDRDFVNLLDAQGPPPRVIWITMGNTSNARMRAALDVVFPEALASLGQGEAMVEITDLMP